MTRKEKRLLVVIGAIVAVYLVSAAVIGIAVYRAGVFVVQVEPKRPGGDEVHVRMPAVLAQAALRFVPDRILTEPAREVREWMPLVRAVSAELSKSPDGVLLEIRSPEEQVRVVKKGRRLLIDVDGAEERVHVVMPLALVGTVLSRFDQAGPGS